jgi:hypothetical protein
MNASSEALTPSSGVLATLGATMHGIYARSICYESIPSPVSRTSMSASGPFHYRWRPAPFSGATNRIGGIARHPFILAGHHDNVSFR